MKVIAFVNNKDKMGKTTCSRALAEYLSVVKKIPTLAIDFDPHCGLSLQFLPMKSNPAGGYQPPLHADFNPSDPEDADWDGSSSIAEIFYGEGVIPYPTFVPGLDLAPADTAKLLAVETIRKHEVAEKIQRRLADFLNSDDVRQAYSAVIIDTPSSKGALTHSVMKAATHIIIPSHIQDNATQNIYGMLQMWLQEALIREKHRPLKLVGILPTFFKKQNTAHQHLLTNLQDDAGIGKYLLPVRMGDHLLFADMPAKSEQQSIFTLPGKHIATDEAVEVCHFISDKVFTHD